MARLRRAAAPDPEHAPSIIIVSLTALGGERYIARTIVTYILTWGRSILSVRA